VRKLNQKAFLQAAGTVLGFELNALADRLNIILMLLLTSVALSQVSVRETLDYPSYYY
jgi:hypothetical protein